MSGKTLNLLVVLGSVRVGRMGDRVAKLVTKSVQNSTKMKITLLDPALVDPSCGLSRQPLHFLRDPEKEALKWMHDTHSLIKGSDAFIMLVTEYNGNMPPALLNLMNSFPPASYRHKPAGIVTYTVGTTGAMRALSLARPFACELGMLPVPGYVPIPLVHENVDDDGNCKNELLHKNLNNLVRNVEWYGRAIQDFKEKGNPNVD